MHGIDPSPGVRVGTADGRIGTIREIIDPGPDEPPQEPDESQPPDWEQEDIPEEPREELAVVSFPDGTEEVRVADLRPVVEATEWEWTQREPDTAVITGYDTEGNAVVERTLAIESTYVRTPDDTVPWRRASEPHGSWNVPAEFVVPVAQ